MVGLDTYLDLPLPPLPACVSIISLRLGKWRVFCAPMGMFREAWEWWPAGDWEGRPKWAVGRDPDTGWLNLARTKKYWASPPIPSPPSVCLVIPPGPPGECLQVFRGHTLPVHAVDFSPDGYQMAARPPAPIVPWWITYAPGKNLKWKWKWKIYSITIDWNSLIFRSWSSR